MSAGFEVSAIVGTDIVDNIHAMESIAVDTSTTKSESAHYLKHRLHHLHHDAMDDWLDVISPNEL